jgi:hypothetical protein
LHRTVEGLSSGGQCVLAGTVIVEGGDPSDRDRFVAIVSIGEPTHAAR